MKYSYDRRKTASPSSILRVIVKNALDGRKLSKLIEAYREALEEDFEEEHGHGYEGYGTAEAQRWYEKVLDYVFDARKKEKELQDAYVRAFLRTKRGAPKSQAKENFDEVEDFPYSDKIPVPALVIAVIGEALGERDAQAAMDLEAHARQRMEGVRDLVVKSRGGPDYASGGQYGPWGLAVVNGKHVRWTYADDGGGNWVFDVVVSSPAHGKLDSREEQQLEKAVEKALR